MLRYLSKHEILQLEARFISSGLFLLTIQAFAQSSVRGYNYSSKKSST